MTYLSYSEYLRMPEFRAVVHRVKVRGLAAFASGVENGGQLNRTTSLTAAGARLTQN
jgi:hypothetical protein